MAAADREAAVLAELKAHDGHRAAEVVGVDIEARTVELAFSSEAEVPRWYGVEVLSHDDGACDLERLNDGAALLDNHHWVMQRGVVEKAWIDADRKGRALVRFSKSDAAEELFQDVADKIKRHVSVGYRVLAIKLVEEREDGPDVYVVTRWQPYEISIVSVPADTSVGVGRDASEAQDIPSVDTAARSDETSHAPEAPVTEPNNGSETRMPADNTPAPVIDTGAIEDAARTAATNSERDRVRAIATAAGNFANVDGLQDLVRSAIEGGESVREFQDKLLSKLSERSAAPLADQARGADVGMSEREVGQFSILKAVRALMEPTDRRAQEDAAFEFEASRAAAEKAGKDARGLMIPTDVLRHSVYVGDNAQRAPLNTGTGGTAATGATGGNLIATSLLASSMIDILRNRATIMQRGRVIGGLVGNIDIPKQLAAANGYWLGEDEDATETGIELGQISLSPKTVAAYSEITRRLAMQSSLDVEAMVRADLMQALALTIDKAGYYGTGSDHQPKGIANYTGIGAQVFAAAGKPTFAELVGMETTIALDNADVDGMAYVANAGFRGHCKTTEKFAGTGQTLWEQGGTVNGYAAGITNQIESGDVFFGNFADLLIAMWGGLDLTVDPYSNSKKGRTRLVVFQDVDFALRRTESFVLGRAAP